VIHAVAADFDGLSDHAIYLCGSPAMISSAKQDFIGRSASMEHIFTEGFTLQCAARAGLIELWSSPAAKPAS
jgi:CDP-4-dehydro-6-deoxyglucose reductase